MMANLLLQRYFYVFFLSVTVHSTISTNSAHGIRDGGSASMEFIRTSCQDTDYPALCFNSLSGYANAIQTSRRLLTKTAISVTLTATKSTLSFMRNLSRSTEIGPSEVGPVNDCLEVLDDSIQELQDSITDMDQIKNDKNFKFLMNSIQTWVSAALTYANTCSDEFSGKSIDTNVKKVVTGKMDSLVQLTSNALALLATYASDHV